jgi:hypothetical protein
MIVIVPGFGFAKPRKEIRNCTNVRRDICSTTTNYDVSKKPRSIVPKFRTCFEFDPNQLRLYSEFHNWTRFSHDSDLRNNWGIIDNGRRCSGGGPASKKKFEIYFYIPFGQIIIVNSVFKMRNSDIMF